MKPVAIRPQLQQILFTRAETLRSSMQARVPVKQAGGVPFTTGQLRDWLAGFFGADGGKAIKCAYCNQHINIDTAVLDHMDPLAAPWHGSPGLENLTCCCQKCNTRKGKMSAAGFIALIDFLYGIDPNTLRRNIDDRDATDLLTRLATGGEGAKAMWKRSSQKRNF